MFEMKEITTAMVPNKGWWTVRGWNYRTYSESGLTEVSLSQPTII
jgi:hypothetical protein